MTKPEDGATPAPGIGYNPQGQGNTALQSHVAFFDSDEDGVIWPTDTFRGFRDIGFGYILSFLAMCIIHSGFSWITYSTLLPDPYFRLQIKNMHRGKHGSDSEIYNNLGEFDETRFNEVFNMYTTHPHTHMSFRQGMRMIYGNRDPFDPFGWFAAAFEWLTTYLLVSPSDGQISKDDIRDVYNGSLFYKRSKSGRKMKVPANKN